MTGAHLSISYLVQAIDTFLIALVLMIFGGGIVLFLIASSMIFGDSGASIVSRVMGLILASVAGSSVLEGITDYFRI